MEKYADMLNMFERINPDGISKIEEIQTKANEKIPFCVSYVLFV